MIEETNMNFPNLLNLCIQREVNRVKIEMFKKLKHFKQGLLTILSSKKGL